MIETQQTYIIYTADGAQRQWEFPYPFQDPTDVALYVREDGEFQKIPASLYTFNQETKKVTYPIDVEDEPVASGTKLMLIRETEVTQEEDSSVANFKSNDVERIADKLTLIAQEHKEWISRCIKYDQVDAVGADTSVVDLENNLKDYADNVAGTAVATHNVSSSAHSSLFAAKQDVIADLATIRSDATAGKIASDTISGYGNIVTHDVAEFATATQGAKADSALQQSDVVSTYSPSGTAPVNGQAVASAVSGEASLRQSADNSLQSQIDAIVSSSDVFDIVGTYADLLAYDTSTVPVNDIIKVLTDSTHNNAPSYYRWTGSVWSYIGSESASYTKSEADAKFLTQTDASATYIDNTELTTALATKASNADNSTITDSNNKISTVAVKEQRANVAVKQWVGTKAQFDAIVTKDENTLYAVTDEPDTSEIDVDSAMSDSSTNPVQNRIITQALAAKQNALPAGTTGYYLQKTASGVAWAAVSSYPTITWYTGVTGTTATIADTTGANLVKVYKNGILLQPTEDFSVSGTTLTLVTALVSTDKIAVEVF